MKTINFLTNLFFIGLLAMLSLSRCSSPEDTPPIKDTTQQGHKEPTALQELLKFDKATKVSGALPAVANIALLKTNTQDTIYALPGIKMPIRISHPKSTILKGIYIAVKQGTFYYDIPIEREEESDTVSVILLEVDPEKEDQTYHIPADIIPYDDTKTPLDKIERIITVEPTTGNTCGILVDKPTTLGDTSGLWTPEWFWFATMVFGPTNEISFLNAPGNTFITNTTYEGCCDPNRPQGKCHPLSTTLNATARASIAYTIESETFTFFTNGTFARQTHERKQNFNPVTTDWCSGTAGYTLDDIVVSYFGQHDYLPGDKTITYGTTYASCDLCGYGSRGGDLKHTCHLLIISRHTEASKEIRIYVRNPVSTWYD